MMINAFNMLHQSHRIIRNRKVSIEHQKLSLLYVNKFEKEYINYQEKMTRKFEKYNLTIALNVPKF